MTEKNVTCAECKFCDLEKRWCRIKALLVAPNSVRSCKVYAANKKQT